MTDGCARIVRRDDPRLWKTALFAPVPARAHLMMLYAVDIELSRATRASRENLIPRMRLQWWRDVIEAAPNTRPEHEVAGPLVDRLLAGDLPPADVRVLIDAHEVELELPLDEAGFRRWAAMRFANRTRIAGRLLSGAGAPACALDEAAGMAMATAFVLRNLARMAAAGRAPLTRLAGDIFDIARGRLGRSTCEWTRDVSASCLRELAAARRAARPSHGTMPAYLPLLYAERTLRRVARDPASIVTGLGDPDLPFDGLRLAWRAMCGRG